MFKVGDIVRVKMNTELDGRNKFRGESGTISRVFKNIPLTGQALRYVIDFKNIHNDGWIFYTKDLEYCRVKATRLAKKMYPNVEVSECGEWVYV